MLKRIKEALSHIERFGKDCNDLRKGLEDLESATISHSAALESFHARQTALESQMKTTTLEHAELYGKTYRLLKRMQQEDRAIEEEPDIVPQDPISERVNARRNRGIPR